MNKPAGVKHAFLEKHESDSPTPAFDGLTAVTALGHAARCALGAIDPWQSTMQQGASRQRFNGFAIWDDLACFPEGLEKWFRPLIGRTGKVKPQRQLALRKRIGKLFPKTQFAARNRLSAAAAFGTTA
jgi:hypothetical protein